MHIIGQPKSLSELPIVSNEEIDGLAKFLDQQISEGTPLEIPQALPLKDLARLIRTAQHYRDELNKLQSSEENQPSRLILPT